MTALAVPGESARTGHAAPAELPERRAGLRSGLYEGRVRHRRFTPRRRAFSYGLAMPLLFLDEVDEVLGRHPLWSRRRAAPVRFSDDDFLFRRDAPLDEEVRDLVADRLGRRPEGPVAMLAHLRTLGWLFNPLTTWYCYDHSGRLEAQVLEVTNTPWKERHAYVVDVASARGAGPSTSEAPATASDTRTTEPAAPPGRRPRAWRASFPKAMHVSPFLPMDLTYDVRATPPGERLALRLEDRSGGELVFDADLTLARRPLDRRTMTGLLLRHPLLPLRVSAAIHTQALRLWASGVPFVPHPQRGTR